MMYIQSIDLEKLAKLKDKKEKGKSKEEHAKDMSDLKTLLQENNMSDADLTTLLTDFRKNLHEDSEKKSGEE